MTHPLTTLVLQQLAAAFPNALRFDELADAASAQLIRHGGTPLAQQRNLLRRELFDLFSARALMLTPRRQQYFNHISQHPHAHRLAHLQSSRGHVSSVRHMDVDLDPLSRHLLSLLDGTRTRGELIEKLMMEIAQDINLRTALISFDHNAIYRSVDRLLALFARHGLLFE